ncbi:4-galactosyl-N-acetylglucosaminide 3-alpha-L-fucosyltransferase FUT6-like [Alligator mississippiensis]|uniref:4-galactosyl-N-acetylglucosaminide 3-alpha-L-fucosyltransferase FUT6-like n=1 Tax=Alligator mississippiensis TaxID=8496 RepID=UPI0028774981|nr:4-galactosyl-N-acetylglucosaminide 3-alpha-L-fucosyltransferase FUT6-like [Alligator mississippiensis]
MYSLLVLPERSYITFKHRGRSPFSQHGSFPEQQLEIIQYCLDHCRGIRQAFSDTLMEATGQKKGFLGKQFFAVLLFHFFFGICLFTYIRQTREPESAPCSYPPSTLPSSLASPENTSSPEKKAPELTILLWTWPFGQSFPLTKCSTLFGIPDCHMTADRSWYHKADAVVMHHRDVYSGPSRLPREPRPPFQRWIWFNLESPSHSPNLGAMNGIFNMTMSYRKDSDIFSPYGSLELLRQPHNFTIPAKTKLVAWVVSNWNPGSRRVQYYTELKKYIHVDVYGRQHKPLSQEQFLPTLSQYKFYLAFENSLHEDYITEKLWKNALTSGTVPVVCGPPRQNYERFLPPDSFIHIDDFPSALELAQYLEQLDKDPVRYERYFQWRTWLRPYITPGWIFHYCNACQVLQRTERYQTMRSLSTWFR